MNTIAEDLVRIVIEEMESRGVEIEEKSFDEIVERVEARLAEE